MADRLNLYWPDDELHVSVFVNRGMPGTLTKSMIEHEGVIRVSLLDEGETERHRDTELVLLSSDHRHHEDPRGRPYDRQLLRRQGHLEMFK